MTIKVIDIGACCKNKLNTLGVATRKHIHKSLEKYLDDASVSGIVLSGKQHFSAGADLTEFSSLGRDSDVISLVDLCHYIEAYPKPVVGAICGVALGGGCEVALACHFRVASCKATIGLPEVNVGVIPGAGGTQRLPRLVGTKSAIEIILKGKSLTSEQALKIGFLDAISNKDQSLVDCAKQWAEWARLLGSLNLPRLSKVVMKASKEDYSVIEATRSKLPPLPMGGQGLHAALDAIHAACTLPFDQGMEREAELFFETLAGSQGQARRHAFFATRAAAPKKALSESLQRHALMQPSDRPCEVGVIGGGTMGSGIALVLLQAGFTVWLVDVQPKALEKGKAHILKTLDTYVKRGKLSLGQKQILTTRLKTSVDLAPLSSSHLVVEAVVENMSIKKSIFKQLDQVVQNPHALLVSNTSTLDIQEISSVVRPQRRGFCAGWHFFSPAHVMKLVEIVVIPNVTSSDTVSLLQALSKRMGKIAVTVGNCDGFVGNRMLHPYTSEMVLLLTEGNTTVESIDKAMQKHFGMALGPFCMSDLAGNDIGYFIRKEKGVVRDLKTKQIGPNRPVRYTELADDLVTELGRIGQKAQKGWYDYDPNIGKGRKPLPSPEVTEFVKRYVTTPASNVASPQDIVERILFPLVNEGFKILEEGIAQKPSDIDVVYLYGYGWPVWRGGPMYWADMEVGLPKLLKTLESFHEKYPGSSYFEPSRLLQDCVALGVTVQEYYKRKKRGRISKL